jgi:hypothetical protein
MCRKSTTWDRRLYFPSEGRRAEDFFTLKNPDGFGWVWTRKLKYLKAAVDTFANGSPLSWCSITVTLSSSELILSSSRTVVYEGFGHHHHCAALMWNFLKVHIAILRSDPACLWGLFECCVTVPACMLLTLSWTCYILCTGRNVNCATFMSSATSRKSG